MSKEKPAQDAVPRVERHHDLGAKVVQRPPQDGALATVSDLRQTRSTNEMGVKLEPAHQSVTLAKFNFARLGQAAHSRAQAIRFAFMTARKNSKACHARRVRHVFHDTGQECIDIIEAAENARKTQ